LGVINEIISFFIKRRFDRIDNFRFNPIEIQNGLYQELILKAKETEFGLKHKFGKFNSVKDFQDSVPVSTYEDLYPYIERTLKGEANLLWPSDIQWFSKSSGTTNAKSKYIPVSAESLEDCHFKGGKDMLTMYLQNVPESKMFDGKGLSIGGAMHTNPFNAKTEVGDISAIITRNLPSWADFVRTPGVEIALMNNWEQKMEKMIEVCSKENVTSILGVPTWAVVLLENIMERSGAKNMLEIWPNFEVFFHGAVSFSPYRELFQQKLFPSTEVFYQETYNASEGFFGIQDDFSRVGEMLLMLDYGIFYEFIPMEEWGKEFPETHTLDTVELDKNYAMVISTNAGLWRYMIGDTVKFTSKYPFRIKVSGRTKHFINAFGEELIVENSEMGISVASKATGAIVKEYTAGPIYMNHNSKGAHEWIIECVKQDFNKEEFIAILDKTLKELNSDYDAKRFNDMALVMPKVHFVEQGTFYKWMEKRGKLGGQNKVPRLSNTREYLDDLLQYI
jgi:hypothetical protein